MDGEGEGEEIFAVFPPLVFLSETMIAWSKAGFYGGFFVFEKDGFVDSGVFRSSSYNDYISRLTSHIAEKLTAQVDRMGRAKTTGSYPGLMVDNVEIARAVDDYIRHRLFKKEIDPAEGKNWKVLLFDEVMNHIKGQLVTQIIKAQEEVEIISEPKVLFTAFSSVDKITVREKYSIKPVKCIYTKCPYPSNKGIFERDFMEFCDHDGEVDAFCRVIENRHTFARFVRRCSLRMSMRVRSFFWGFCGV